MDATILESMFGVETAEEKAKRDAFNSALDHCDMDAAIVVLGGDPALEHKRGDLNRSIVAAMEAGDKARESMLRAELAEMGE